MAGLTFSVMASAIALTVGCVEQQNADGNGGAGGSGNAGSGGGGGVPAGPPPLSCLESLQCIVECAEPDGPCGESCYYQGTADAQDKVLALATCLDTAQCTEETCVYDQCGAELDACVQASGPQSTGTPLPGPAPAGSVPGYLVGSWAGARQGNTVSLTLGADGTASLMVAKTWQQYACMSYSQLVKTGSIVVEPNTMTLYATSVTQTDQSCSPPATETSQAPMVEQLPWYPHETDPNVIYLVDAACAAQYPGQENCNTLGCPIAMYCTSRMDRQ